MITKIQTTAISQALLKLAPLGFEIKPTKEFYDLVGINKHRFAKLYNGKILANTTELKSLSEYFKCTPNDLIN